jgi:UDP-2,3-diacylglucosamine hydrolase
MGTWCLVRGTWDVGRTARKLLAAGPFLSPTPPEYQVPRTYYLTRMLGHQLVVVQDVHLGACSRETEEAFFDFLDTVPTLGDSLLINGDLYDFFFAWKRVIPRHAFRCAAALQQLRQRVPIVMTGGNHDRWGGSFWDSLDIPFAPVEMDLEVAYRKTLAIHGDGITERHWSARLLYHLTKNPVLLAGFRLLHPDLACRIVDKMTNHLGNTVVDPAVLTAAAERQGAWARARLNADPSLGLVVMGHTHRPATFEVAPGRVYLNPGAWLDGYRYGVVSAGKVELRTFGS